MYAKKQLASQVKQVYALNKFLEKKKRSLSYIDQEAFVTYVEINKKSFRTVVAMVP